MIKLKLNIFKKCWFSNTSDLYRRIRFNWRGGGYFFENGQIHQGKYVWISIGLYFHVRNNCFEFIGRCSFEIERPNFKSRPLLAQNWTTGHPIHTKPVYFKIDTQHNCSHRIRRLELCERVRLPRWIFGSSPDWLDTTFYCWSGGRKSVQSDLVSNCSFVYDYTAFCSSLPNILPPKEAASRLNKKLNYMCQNVSILFFGIKNL